MVVYDRVAKGIEPKKAKLAEAEAALKKTMDELAVKKAALQEVLDRVAGLQRLLKETQDKSAELEAKAEKGRQQLVRAGKLIGGLGDLVLAADFACSVSTVRSKFALAGLGHAPRNKKTPWEPIEGQF